MWYVINKTNGKKLKKFERKIIIPLFNHLIYYKHAKFVGSFELYLDKLSDSVCEKEILQYIYKRKNDKIKFFSLIDSLLLNYSEDDIRHHFYIYLSQNKELKNHADFINKQVVPDEWSKIFKKFFYEHFFDMETIWDLIDGIPYSREIFHENFKEDNQITVCPYCDIDTINNNGNLEVEHFWPESEYPFLAMNPLNLYSSCISCNRPFEGKGVNTFKPITMPFYEQIGDYVHFQHDLFYRKIRIKGEKQSVKNYIKLLKLDNRYSKNDIYSGVEKNAAGIYETLKQIESILGRPVTEKEATTYIENRLTTNRKRQNLFFVTRDSFSSYDKYMKFIH